MFGNTGLNDYRNHRTAATDLVPGLRNTAYSGCFHDGEKVLKAVTNMHIQVRKKCRRDDHIVSDIVTIVGEMLGDERDRPKSVGLYRRFRTALATAKACSERERHNADDASFPEAFQTFQDPQVFRAQPPELPPTGLGMRMVQVSPQLAYSPEPSMLMDNIKIPPTSPTWPLHHTDEKRSPMASSSQSPHRSVSLPKTVRYPCDSTHSPRPSHPNSRHCSWPVSGPTPEGDEGTPVVSSVQSNDVRSPPTIEQASNGYRVDTSTIRQSIQNGKDTRIDQRHEDCPKTSVGQVLKWIAKKKKNLATKPLRGDPYLGRLHGRDQVGDFGVSPQ